LVYLSFEIAGWDVECLGRAFDEFAAFKLDVALFVAALRSRNDAIDVGENGHFSFYVGACEPVEEFGHLPFII